MLASALFISCHRNDDINDPVEDTTATPDTSALIHGVDIDPDTLIRSYSSMQWNGMDLNWTPLDSSASLQLDMNDDGALDLRISTSHTYHFLSPHCCYYWYGGVGGNGIDVLGLDPANSPIHRLTPLASGEWIGPDGEWHGGASFHFDPPTSGAPSYGISGDFYAGIRLTVDGHPHYGWVLMGGVQTVHVRAYALNMIPGNPIRAGRME